MKTRNDSRLILDMRKLDIHVFEEFGRYNYSNTQSILPLHFHVDAIEICYLSRGNQTYQVGNDVYQVRGGECFITYPNEIHGTGNLPEEKGILYWFSLKKPISGSAYLGLSVAEAQHVFSRLVQLPLRIFPANAEVEQLLQQIIQVYFSPDADLQQIEMKNLLVSLILCIIHCGEDSNRQAAHSEPILKVITYIENNIFEIFDLEDLAGQCCLSLSRFKHRFKKEIGMPPGEFIIRKKLEKAQILLEEGTMSIKDIAYELGFSSPSYFATVFKQYLRYSPTEHRRKNF